MNFENGGICPNCSQPVPENSGFCPECGAAVQNKCSSCGAVLKEGQLFCAECGTKNGGEAPVQEIPQNENTFNSAIDEYNATVSATPQKSQKKTIMIIAAVAAVIVIFFVMKSGVKKGINFSKEFSEYESESWCKIASDGSYMRLDTNPNDQDDKFIMDAWDAIEDANIKLGFTEVLMEKMGETSFNDGRLEDENDKVKVSWSYHPDKGLEVLYEKK